MPDNHGQQHSEAGFVKNSFALLSARIIDPLASFVMIILIGKYAGVSILGIYVIAYNLYAIFNSVALLGLNNFVMREIAKDKSRAGIYLINIGAIGFMASILSAALIYSILYLLNYPHELKEASGIIALALIPAIWMQLCEAEYVALGRTKYFLFAVIIEALFRIFLCIFVLSLGLQVSILMAAIVCSKVLGLVISLCLLISFIGKPYFRVDFGFCKKVIKEIVPTFALLTILANIWTKSDVFILSKVREISEVGWYGLASKFTWTANFLITSLVITVFPVISKLVATNMELFEKFSEKFLTYIIILVLFIIMMTYILSNNLILFFFGRKFINSILPLKILIWSMLPGIWASFYAYVLIAGNKQKLALYALGIALTCSFIANIILSSKFGYIGTSIAVSLSMGALAVIQYFFVRKHIFKSNILQTTAKPFISIVVAGAIIFLLKERLDQWSSAFLAMLIYFSCLFLLKAFPAKDTLLFNTVREIVFKYGR